MLPTDRSFTAFVRSGLMGQRLVATGCVYFISWSTIMVLCVLLMSRGAQVSTPIVVVISGLVLLIVSLVGMTARPNAPVRSLLRRAMLGRTLAVRDSHETTVALHDAASRATVAELGEMVKDLYGEIQYIRRKLDVTNTLVDSATTRDAITVVNSNAATLQQIREMTLETHERTRELEHKVDVLLRRAQSAEDAHVAARITLLAEQLSSVAEATLHAAAMEALRRVMREILEKTSASEGTPANVAELPTRDKRESDG